MKRQRSYWNDVGKIKPPLNTAVLCFNGIIFVGVWNGSNWYSNYFEVEPDPPPSHWRILPMNEPRKSEISS